MKVLALIALFSLSCLGTVKAMDIGFGGCWDLPSRPFNHSRVTDTWTEHARTAVPWEIGVSCVNVDLSFDEGGNLEMKMTGKAPLNQPYNLEVLASKTRKENEFTTKIVGNDMTLRFEIDDDLLLLITCTSLPGGLVGRDAWILARKGTEGSDLEKVLKSGQSAVHAYHFDRLDVQDRKQC